MPLRVGILKVPGELLWNLTDDDAVVTNGDVRAAVELLLGSAAYAALLGDRVHAPAVPCVVLPLQHTGWALHPLRQAEFHLDVQCGGVVAWRDHVSGLTSAVQDEQVAVQTFLGDVGERTVMLAQAELKVSLQCGTEEVKYRYWEEKQKRPTNESIKRPNKQGGENEIDYLFKLS